VPVSKHAQPTQYHTINLTLKTGPVGPVFLCERSEGCKRGWGAKDLVFSY